MEEKMTKENESDGFLRTTLNIFEKGYYRLVWKGLIIWPLVLCIGSVPIIFFSNLMFGLCITLLIFFSTYFIRVKARSYWKLAFKLMLIPFISSVVLYFLIDTLLKFVGETYRTLDLPFLPFFMIGIPLISILFYLFCTRQDALKRKQFKEIFPVAVDLNTFFYLVWATGLISLSPYFFQEKFLNGIFIKELGTVLSSNKEAVLNFIRATVLPFLVSNALLKYLIQRDKFIEDQKKDSKEG
ncbi:hypothetical protein P364_0133090 [Paenibacillus sp. MAEPY2]|nr:hypothetical protein P363_0133705 [Paenibacillus sp. MAEPY1]KGP77436.1 hypothetical protein P364_0133090 [Paenibacillus sp. MAEPY2]